MENHYFDFLGYSLCLIVASESDWQYYADCYQVEDWAAGFCYMDDSAIVIRGEGRSPEALKAILVHELGHVYQYVYGDLLETSFKFPSNHYGSSLPEENFCEVLRIAITGCDLDRDEDLLFEPKVGVMGVYMHPVPSSLVQERALKALKEVLERNNIEMRLPDFLDWYFA